mmetsp:Transcript_35032/g.69221  ORF Transcript_35032/g.69221 Transcript_35032/m.69221 type:complete len:469 (-) Transcript_35032:75-1481(-)
MKFIQTMRRETRDAAAGRRRGNESTSKDTAPSSNSQESKFQDSDDVAMFAKLPKLRDVPEGEQSELLRLKLEACSHVFDFTNDTYQKGREAKRLTLLEIVDCINSNQKSFVNASLMRAAVDMVGANIFRALHVKSRDPLAFSDPEGDEPNLEPAWPHLQIVYEFFLCFVVANNVDPKVAKQFVDQNFMMKFLDLFDSEDPRERDYLKTILHRIYGKFMALRSFIRRAMQHVFFKVIYECETHNGVGELLEILGSVINGFALPLKEEHKDFLVKALIPLHKVKFLAAFYQQLSYCMSQYVEKDRRLAYEIITSILRYWPVSTASKQVLFLNELEETLELTQPSEFHRLQDVLCRRLSMCITCPHFQVAERSLFYWNNDFVVKLINQNRHKMFPVIVAALYRNSKQHWNSAVHGLTFNVLKILMEADPQFFDECAAKSRVDEELQEQAQREREHRWEHLQKLHDAQTGAN